MTIHATEPARSPRRSHRIYDQQVQDLGTVITGPRHVWSCSWKWPSGERELCAEGVATSAAHGIQLIGEHLTEDHDVPAIPTQPTG